jgi:hypothetical protein
MAAAFTKKFGIKEVADVGFYAVGDIKVEGNTITATKAPVLKFDTLKVSTIEMTAESSEARGGKGNPALISWDYGREITVNLEDALLSMDTLSHLFEGKANEDDIITINANKFPGTYAIVGVTYARDEDGKDNLFYFYIPKAKIQSETTLTMEAEGDPTVFNMSLKVLRGNAAGDMMQLIGVKNEADTAPDIVLPGVTA